MEQDQKSKNLRFSYFEGIFACLTAGFTQDYFVPFLLLLGGTAKHVGILNALPNFFSALFQLMSPDLTDFLKSRKKIVEIALFLQAMILIMISTTAFMGGVNFHVFIAIIVIFTVFGSVATPAWNSLLSDLVPANRRGEYFGWRNMNLGIITVGSTLLAGVILHSMKQVNVYQGFFIIFSLAFLWRIMSWVFLRKIDEHPLVDNKESYFSILNFLFRLRESNYAKFVLFVAMMNFSVNLASPYFAVLMLKDLKFSYLLYTMINISATLTIFLAMRRWGRHADKVGNLKVIRFTAPLIGIIPFLWILNRTPIFLLFAQIFSGFLWAGFNLSCTNFIYDAVSPAKRTRCIAYYNVFNGLALCAGALCGGFLVQKLPPLLGYPILTLLLISSVGRFLVGFFLPLRLKEVRSIEHVSNYKLLFSMIGLRPITGIENKTIHF